MLQTVQVLTSIYLHSRKIDDAYTVLVVTLLEAYP